MVCAQNDQNKASEFIATNSVVEDLKKVVKRFEEEQKRVRSYLDESTAAKVESELGIEN